MTFEQIRKKADQLRAVPLTSVLRIWGARPDRHDQCKWHTSQGILSLKGAKFINWNRGTGGGGAIDLVIHLNHCGFREALDWLQRHFPVHLPLPEERGPPQSPLNLPPPDPVQLARIKHYLTAQRAIASALIDPLIQSGTLYADHHANALFLLLAKDATVVGAELRGTTSAHWCGIAPGSRKDLGFFSIPADTAQEHRSIILCESAIDAISCFALHPHHRCISTSGARPNPPWLGPLIDQGYSVCCGFDADDTGDRMAQAMIAFHSTVKRFRPARKDWNVVLRSRA